MDGELSRRHLNLLLFAEEKTEAPTPRRRAEARREGQVFKSVELTAALTLLAVYATIHFLAPGASLSLTAWSREFLAQAPRDWSVGEVRGMFAAAVLVWARATAPFLLIGLVLALALNLMQTGFAFTGAGLVPRFSHIDPVRGFQRLFSLRSTIELVKGLIKLAVLVAVSYVTLRDAALSFPGLVAMEPAGSAAAVAGWVDQLAWRAALAFLLLAVADFFYQRWEYERNLRMTRAELKQETKETEGDPQIRGLRRRRQRELARQRMIADVRRATVVVTNPDHYAVALRYVPEEMDAPVALAKGKGFLAQRIKEAARRHDVTVVEDPPLARALYRVVDVGKAIPEDLYQAVAEVLAFVWRLKGYRAPAGR